MSAASESHVTSPALEMLCLRRNRRWDSLLASPFNCLISAAARPRVRKTSGPRASPVFQHACAACARRALVISNKKGTRRGVRHCCREAGCTGIACRGMGAFRTKQLWVTWLAALVALASPQALSQGAPTLQRPAGRSLDGQRGREHTVTGAAVRCSFSVPMRHQVQSKTDLKITDLKIEVGQRENR
jgi:hypothetical protein